MVAKISGEDFFRLLDRVVTHEMIDEMLNEHEKEVIYGEMLTGYQNVYNAISKFFNKTINLAEKVGFSAKSLIIQSPNDFSHIPKPYSVFLIPRKFLLKFRRKFTKSLLIHHQNNL